MITYYNQTKGGVDVVDKLCVSYNCARSTRRWPVVIFYNILNIAGINSQIVYADHNILRRNFLRQLSSELIRPYLVRHASMSNTPRSLKVRLQELCNVETSNEQENVKPGRCSYCDHKKNRKTRFNCFRCNKFMCLEDIIDICRTCK